MAPPLADPILRGALFLFSAVAIGLVGAYVHDDTSSSRVRFAVFAASFSLLFGVFFNALAAFLEFIPTFILAVFDILNAIFLFTAATAIAAKIHAHSCGNTDYLLATFPNGSSKTCHIAQASTAFLYFAWFVATLLAVYTVIGTLRGNSFGIPGRRARSVPRTGVPTMSQV